MRASLTPGSPRRTPFLIAGCGLVFIVVVVGVTLARLYATAGPSATDAPLPTPPPPPPPPLNPVATAITPGIVVYPAPPREGVDASAEPAPPPKKGKAPEPLPATPERTAVDAVNRGDLPGALAIYRQLAQKQPDNPAYANAVRVIQQRLTAGP